jgi:hypothetical protein
MSIISSRYIADHPRPFMPTAMPQFHIYSDVHQNAMRPTWKGIDGLGGLRGTNPVTTWLYGYDTTAAPAVIAERSTNRGLMIGGAAGIVLGGLLGYFIGRK